MKSISTLNKSVLCAALVAWAGLAGCERQETSPDEEIQALLAQADAYDGTADNVVSKCLVCGSTMEGLQEEEFTRTVHGYTVHFCSEECRDKFDEDPDAAILAMELPEDAESPEELPQPRLDETPDEAPRPTEEWPASDPSRSGLMKMET